MRTVITLLSLVTMACIARGAPGEEVRDFSKHFGDHQGAFVLLDAAENKWVRHDPKRCREQATPCSTFKIPNALIALESGVADGPEFSLKWDGKKRPIEAWNKDHTLRSAFSVSCLWFFQELARRTGQKRMDEWVKAFRYGNQDTSGGLTEFWLSSSLKISPDEQVEFLQRLQTGQLPVSKKALDTLLEIMVVAREDRVTYRGKTGTAGDPIKDIATLGWWVGSVSTPKGDYFFATNIADGKNPSGREARRISEAILTEMGIPMPGKEPRKPDAAKDLK